MHRRAAVVILCVGLLSAQEAYNGPVPAHRNVPYLVHADSLVETEAGSARERLLKDGMIYFVPGDRSPSRTPLACPTLVIDADGAEVEKLRLFRLRVRGDHREIAFSRRDKSGGAVLRTHVTRISGGIYRVSVLDSLEPGEYALSPDGSDAVFCFAVF